MYKIDCPDGRKPFGKEAKKYTASLVARKSTQVTKLDSDKYCRMIGVATANGKRQ
ncbi:thermonuclease family protein [Desulfofustis limnaeus]|uniref:thermonuclease family protein n=1 Tax=Desulfofustis limnaeus TaxID=2740163 RepID=UPI00338DF38D